MYVVREVLNCRPGKVGDLAKKFQALGKVMEDMGITPFRLYNDVSGERFWTLIVESEHETLDDFVSMEERVLSVEKARDVMAGYHDLVEQGRREIYKSVV